MKILKGLLLGGAMLCATPSQADLFVSGDSNIFGSVATTFSLLPENQTFLKNIMGSSVLLQGTTTPFMTSQMSGVSSYLTGAGLSHTLLGSGAALTASEFAGHDLFVGFAPSDGYSAGEIALMADFLASGGSVLLTGENAHPDFAATNGYVNAALVALGRSRQIFPDILDPGFNVASIATSNAYTAGTAGFRYAAASEVRGGTALYKSLGGVTFLAVEAVAPPVPEPSSWALMVLGIGAVGAALRHRKTSISFA